VGRLIIESQFWKARARQNLEELHRRLPRIAAERKLIGWLFVILVLSLSIRLFPLLHGEFLGADSFYHASVVRNAREEGALTNHNPLARCPWGVQEGAPRGMYLVPYVLSAVMDVRSAMIVATLLFALFGILTAYLLLARLFSRDGALLGALLFGVSFAYIQRSAALTFRGEHFGLPFLFLALYWALGALDGKCSEGFLSGAALGITAMVWNGFPILVFIYWAAVLPALLFRWTWPAGKTIPPLCALTSLVMSYVLFGLSMLITPQAGAGAVFLRWGWIVGGLLAVLLAVSASVWQRTPPQSARRAILVVFLAVGGGAAFVLRTRWGMLTQLVIGESAFFSTVSEFRPPSPGDFWVSFGPLLLLMLPGLLTMVRGMDYRRILVLGWLLSCLALLTLARRFLFLASFPMILPIASLAVWVRARRKLLLIASVLVMLSVAHSLQQSSRLLMPLTSGQFVSTLQELRGQLPPGACVLTMWDISSIVQWHAGMPTYTASVGGQDVDRIERTTRFFLGSDSFDAGDEPGERDPLYFALIRESDLPRLLRLNVLANVSDLTLILLDQPERRTTENLTVLRFQERFYVALSEESAEAAYLGEADLVIPLSFFMLTEDSIYRNMEGGVGGCLYLGESSYYLNSRLCRSNLFRMLTMQPVPWGEPVMLGKGFALYRLDVPGQGALR